MHGSILRLCCCISSFFLWMEFQMKLTIDQLNSQKYIHTFILFQYKKIKTFCFTKKEFFFLSRLVLNEFVSEMQQKEMICLNAVYNIRSCSHTLTFTHVSSHIPKQPGFLILPFCLYRFTLFHSFMCQAFQCSNFSISLSHSIPLWMHFTCTSVWRKHAHEWIRETKTNV